MVQRRSTAPKTSQAINTCNLQLVELRPSARKNKIQQRETRINLQMVKQRSTASKNNNMPKQDIKQGSTCSNSHCSMQRAPAPTTNSQRTKCSMLFSFPQPCVQRCKRSRRSPARQLGRHCHNLSDQRVDFLAVCGVGSHCFNVWQVNITTGIVKDLQGLLGVILEDRQSRLQVNKHRAWQLIRHIRFFKLFFKGKDDC